MKFVLRVHCKIISKISIRLKLIHIFLKFQNASLTSTSFNENFIIIKLKKEIALLNYVHNYWILVSTLKNIINTNSKFLLEEYWLNDLNFFFFFFLTTSEGAEFEHKCSHWKMPLNYISLSIYSIKTRMINN